MKKWLDDLKVSYKTNILAGIQAIIVSIAVIVCYVVLTGEVLTPQTVVWAFCLIVLSWLCAMVGYDKVKQTILQIEHKTE